VCDASAAGKILESNPHLHGTPVYWNGTVYYWGTQDWPHALTWDASTGMFPAQDPRTHKMSTDLSDEAPGPPPNFEFGGFMSLSGYGTTPNGSGIVWASIRVGTEAAFYAFDANPATYPKKHIWQWPLTGTSDIGVDGHFAYPMVSNGNVYVVNLGCSWCGGAAAQLLRFSTSS
jgi:hypothetical protein